MPNPYKNEKTHAFFLAKSIAGFWAKQGASVAVEVVPELVHRYEGANVTALCVRSDMQNGLPRSYKPTPSRRGPTIIRKGA
jgi:hypothetical protein